MICDKDIFERITSVMSILYFNRPGSKVTICDIGAATDTCPRQVREEIKLIGKHIARIRFLADVNYIDADTFPYRNAVLETGPEETAKFPFMRLRDGADGVLLSDAAGLAGYGSDIAGFLRFLKGLGAGGASFSLYVDASSVDTTDDCLDDMPILITTDLPGYQYYDNGGLLFLDSGEKQVFEKGSVSSVMIKDPGIQQPSSVKEKADAVRTAADKSCLVRFSYRPLRSPNILRISTYPLALFRNITDDLYYCVSLSDDGAVMAYRIDRILFDIDIDTSKRIKRTKKDREIVRKLRYSWGSPSDVDTDPIHVAVKIYPETRNIIKKIQSDVSGRTYGRLYEKDGYYIYEDDVTGLASFRSWVFSYGSSMVVIEPASLREEVLRSAERKLKNYEEGNFTDYA